MTGSGAWRSRKDEQVEERALAEHREQEAGEREVGLVEQGLERRAAARARHAERVAAQPGASGEHLDVAGLVGDLHREELHDLAEVRVDPAEEPGRHDERGLLVLDQVGHDLHDRVLDLGRAASNAASQSIGGRRVPLAGDGLGVEPGRDVGPDDVALVEVEARLRAARLDQRAARRQAPRGRRRVPR